MKLNTMDHTHQDKNLELQIHSTPNTNNELKSSLLLCRKNGQVDGLKSSQTQNIDTAEEREKWQSKGDFILSLVGLCIGLGNIWRFPYLCYENGGGAFLIPYLLTLFLGGIPTLFLELLIGQTFSMGGLGVWKLCPMFKGVGYAAILMAFWLSIYYIVVLAWALFYMFNSFVLGQLPWSSCGNAWNSECCTQNISCIPSGGSGKGLIPSFIANRIQEGNYSFSQLATETNPNLLSAIKLCSKCPKLNSSVYEYWKNYVLEESAGIEHPGSLRWPLAGCLLFAWVLVYFCIWRGVKWTGKVVYFTALFPYALMICLFFRAITLPGAMEGVRFYLKPNVTVLKGSKVWLDASSQIFFTYGLGLGSHIALASYNPKRNNCQRDALIVCTVNTLTSLFSGFVIFSIIGYIANSQSKPVSEVAQSGPGLAFIVYPAAVSTLPGSAIWSVLFFFMIILVGLDSQFCTLEGLLTAILDEWPKYFRHHRQLLLLGLILVSYLIGLATVTQGGMYVFKVFDHYSASGMALLFLIFSQCIAFSWCVGIERLKTVVSKVVGIEINLWWKICWVILCPTICLSITIFSIVNYENLKYDNYEFPSWTSCLGAFIGLNSVVCIPIYMVYYVVYKTFFNVENSQENFFSRLKRILRPEINLTDFIEVQKGQELEVGADNENV